jgi:hypothetical protein
MIENHYGIFHGSDSCVNGYKTLAYFKNHFFKIQRAITPFLTDCVQCHWACIILLSIYTLIPSFNEIRQNTSKIWLRTQKCQKDRRTDNAETISLRLWRGIINIELLFSEISQSVKPVHATHSGQGFPMAVVHCHHHLLPQCHQCQGDHHWHTDCAAWHIQSQPELSFVAKIVESLQFCEDTYDKYTIL